MMYDVLTSILIEADSEDEAIEKVRRFLGDGMKLDYNYMVHKAEETGETIDDLRSRQRRGR